ncbi:MAG: type II toxin-antitoxin system prevent-host-death family antitoxin [Longimicrobiales bacterium]
MTVSIADLKARLSEYIAMARRGEEVVVTDRGRPVARLAPLRESMSADTRTSELVRAGVVRGPTQAIPLDFLTGPRVSDPEGALMKALLDERSEGR